VESCSSCPNAPTLNSLSSGSILCPFCCAIYYLVSYCPAFEVSDIPSSLLRTLFVPSLRTHSSYPELSNPPWVGLAPILAKVRTTLSADPRLIPFPLGSIAMRQGLVFKYPARGWNGVPLNTSLAVNDSTSTHACRCTLACMQSSLDPSIYVQVV